MLRSLHIVGVGPAPELRMECAERINLVTGDNGLGKSFILDVAWWALTRTWAGRQATPLPVLSVEPRIGWDVRSDAGTAHETATFDFDSWEWPRPLDTLHDPGLVVYARIDGSFSIWDPARNKPRRIERLGHGQSRPAAFHFARDDVWDGLRNEDGSFACNGLVTDWVAWQRDQGSAWKQLTAALDGLREHDATMHPGPPARLSPFDSREYPTLDVGYDVVPLGLASAGVRRIAALAYVLVWTWQEHQRARELQREAEPLREITVLLDEAEAHLHPKWQRTILTSLVDVVQRLTRDDDARVQVIAATHSPLLPVSLEPVFDPARDKLMTFDLVDGVPELHDVPWQRRGDVNSWLKSDMFDLGEARSEAGERAVQRMRAAIEGRETDRAELEAVDADLRAALAEQDPVRIRWAAYLARATGDVD